MSPNRKRAGGRPPFAHGSAELNEGAPEHGLSCPAHGRFIGAPGKIWVGSVVIDCKNFPEMIRFWKAALGYEQRLPSDDDWVLLYDPDKQGPNLAFQKDPVGPGPTYWDHLDLYSSDPEGEVRRLQSLGAEVIQPAREGFDYVTLADPDGNPFDVIDTRRFKFGQRTE